MKMIIFLNKWSLLYNEICLQKEVLLNYTKIFKMYYIVTTNDFFKLF